MLRGPRRVGSVEIKRAIAPSSPPAPPHAACTRRVDGWRGSLGRLVGAARSPHRTGDTGLVHRRLPESATAGPNESVAARQRSAGRTRWCLPDPPPPISRLRKAPQARYRRRPGPGAVAYGISDLRTVGGGRADRCRNRPATGGRPDPAPAAGSGSCPGALAGPPRWRMGELPHGRRLSGGRLQLHRRAGACSAAAPRAVGRRSRRCISPRRWSRVQTAGFVRLQGRARPSTTSRWPTVGVSPSSVRRRLNSGKRS